MSTLVSIIIFFVIFGVLVISHEGGHFLIARANGIRVREFTVGLGPQIFKKEKNGTVYAIRLLPVGGACIFDGMPGMDFEEDEEEEENAWKASPLVNTVTDVGADSAEGVPFSEAKVWSRIATVFAGPLFNFILAFLLALVITAATPWNYAVVNGFVEGSTAQEAGLMQGDRIVRMNGAKITQAAEVTMLSRFNDGEEITLTVDRGGTERVITFMPSYSEEEGRYYMGVYLGEQGRVSGAQIVPYAWYSVKYYITTTYRSLWLLVTGRYGIDGLAGPVGMVQMVDETYEGARTFGMSAVLLNMLELTLLLSVNLGIMNLLPIPALDGGRLLFLFLEVLRGKPIPPEKEGYVHLAGIILLLVLMVLVLFNDVRRIIG